MRGLLLVALFALTVPACADDATDGAAPTPTSPPASDPPTPPSSPGYSLPPLDTPPQSPAGCPVDDEALCQFALDLRNAVATGDMPFVTERLAPKRRACAGMSSFEDRDIGCDSPDATSDPVLPIARHGSDCCFADPEFFARMFLVRLGLTIDHSWRVWGIVEGSPFWEGAPSVLLIRGEPDDRQVIEVGTAHDGDRLAIAGAIFGTASTLYLHPEAQLRDWNASAPPSTSAAVPMPSSSAGLAPLPLDTPPQSPAGCPVDDEALCQFALDLRNAVATGDSAFIEQRLVLAERQCSESSSSLHAGIGCEAPDDLTNPVAPIATYGSDVRYADNAGYFRWRLQHRIFSMVGSPSEDGWRIWGIIQASPFWSGSPAILLIHQRPDDRFVIEVGTASQSRSPGIAGAILGTVSTFHLHPEATLIPWQ